MSTRKRYAVVGAGARAETFVRSLVTAHRDRAELVAFADVNAKRIAAHNRWLPEIGHPPVPAYRAEDFIAMLDKERVDVVIVTSVDATHERYIVAALDAGRSVITEKPMTTTAQSCTRILTAARQARARAAAAGTEAPTCAVAFNYRYNPTHVAVRRLLAAGEIGEIGSVHFEWLLDVRHGADYFRRWHRNKADSGGLLVHKATHHFDLVNWWLGAVPAQVYAQGRLFFYGEQAGERHGHARDYDRAHGSPAATGDPFALHLADSEGLRRLYLDAEGHDGYHRDRNVFAPGVTIEDDMALVVRYSTGATMSYHLTAYSPWEGYRVMFNGTKGRLELNVVENDHVAPRAGELRGASLHGAEAAAENGWATVRVCPFWRQPYEVDVGGHVREGHGGADARMTRALFGADPGPDPLGRGATERDGALSLLTGLAANESLATGAPVRVADLLDLGPELLSPAGSR
jgi:predicted dehydrogenase